MSESELAQRPHRRRRRRLPPCQTTTICSGRYFSASRRIHPLFLAPRRSPSTGGASPQTQSSSPTSAPTTGSRLSSASSSTGEIIVFNPILDPPDRIPPERFDLRIRDGRTFQGADLLGCRHGPVLLIDHLPAEVLVCDPISGQGSRYSLSTGRGMRCRRPGPRARHFHSSPFKVVLVFSSDGRPLACVYSSETGMWGDLISADVLFPACFG